MSARLPNLVTGGITVLTLSAVALVSTIYLKKDRKVGGVVLIIVALVFLANADRFGYLELIFIGISGLMAVFRK